MKKSTLLLFKFVLFSFILFPLLFLGAFNAVGNGTWRSTYYTIVSQNTDNGQVQFDFLYQKVGGDGSVIPHASSVYLQYQNTSGSWVNCMEVYQVPNKTRYYSAKGLGSVYVSISTPPGGSENFEDWGAGNYHMYIRISNPSGIYNIPVNFRWVQDDSAIGNLFPLTFYKPNAPTGLQASTNECNKVNLSWSEPSNIRSGSNTYYIYRNGSYKGTSFSTSFTDNTPSDGTSYDYKVLLYNGSQSGEFSSEVAGNSKPVPEPPSSVTASTDRCDGTVKVQWQWNTTAPEKFEVERMDSINNIKTTLSSTISGTENYYEDTPPIVNHSYYYRVRALNDCNDWGIFSNPEEGYSPDAPTDPTVFKDTIVNEVVILSWIDNSDFEDNYILTRTNENTGVISEYELDADDEQFEDDNAQYCIRYKYELKAVNNCGNSNVQTIKNVFLKPDLSTTFWDGSFKASKGFYPDVVHLEWNNDNRDLINTFYIYRKEYGTSDSTLLSALDASLTTFDDKYAVNSVLYEYSIIAEKLCDTFSVFSNVVSDIGFKVPTGVVSGKVTYQSGNPTAGVTVTAESSEVPEFSSIVLNGSSSFMQITDPNENLQNAFTFQAYLRFSQLKDVAVFNKGSQYKLNYTSGNFVFNVGNNPLNFTYTPPLDTFIQVTTIFDGSTSSLFIDGELKAQKTGVSPPAVNTADFVLGKEGATDYFNGNIDEIRIWSIALDSIDVGMYYNKYINGNEPELIGYYRLNENINIDRFFDISKTGNSYNENHGTLYNCSYSTVVPAIEQLWFRAITDKTGNYLITGIPYLSGGSIYKIVPMFAPHEFNPEYKTLFVGQGATVHNNIDFIDVSTVDVSLTVFYNGTQFPVKDVWVKVDGVYISDKNNQLVRTKEDGTVDFEVPIGEHYLSFEKQSHTFNNPFYPAKDSEGNIKRVLFNKPTQIKILDTTRVRLAGRIVGGPVEEAKILGIDKLPSNPSINNIGVVNITLTTVKQAIIDTLNNSKTISFSTDPNTGEYAIWLLPEQYKPNGNLAIKNDHYIFNSDEDKAIIDLTSRFYDMVETDSAFSHNPGEAPKFIGLDTTAAYNLKRNWIYRSAPDFEVLNENGGKIISHLKYGYTNESDVTDSITLAYMTGNNIVYPFGKPIFFFAQPYDLYINAFEKYINPALGADSIDMVPVTDGKVIIANDFALEGKEIELKLDANGETVYSFLAGFPNIADPYTKNLNITFEAGSSHVTWPTMEAYILGGRPTGNNFVTTGPNLVDYILRDPPGSNSFATINKGHVTTIESTFSATNTTSASLGLKWMIGASITTNSGTPFFSLQNKIETNNTLGVTATFSATLGGGYDISRITTFDETYSTSDEASFVGAEGDVFFGQSTNIIYGVSKIMGIMPETKIPSGADTIAQHNSYVISIEKGLRISPEFDTYFIYTQNTIENEIIPNLLYLRNIILESASYEKVFTDFSDPRFGSNNDDNILWGSNASDDFYDGPSYIYTPVDASVIDSVRFYNSQIDNWYGILSTNEKEKLNAVMDNKHKNISFGGGATYTSSIGSEWTHTGYFIYNFSIGVEVATSLGFSLNKAGFTFDGSISNTSEIGGVVSGGFTDHDEISYTLADGDSEDYITVDVKKCQSGHGPVFITRGGQTSCPYEGEELTQYFEPGDHTLSFATMKIDGPQLSIDNPISPVVPETAPALFTLNLSNVSEAEKDNWYIIGVDVASNPDGAKIMMDGSTINDGMTIFVPYGKTVVKTLEVWKGRDDVNEYKNLSIYLSSTCDDISESVSISAYFASACSPVEFDLPGKGWVVNVNNHDTMLVQISGYNLQHAGFDDIHFQFTPTGTSDWTTTQVFTNDPLLASEPNTTYINSVTTLQYYWDMSSLPDRGYDIRLISHCENGSKNVSQVLSGILDGQRPQVFGSPQPADGILNVDDDIAVRFNEPIEGGLLTQYNFDIKGTLNNYPVKHDAYLRFNGMSDYSYIPKGISLNEKSFTIEFWVRPDDYGNAVILSQGNDPSTSIEIGLRDGDKTYFKLGNVEKEAPFQFNAVVPRTAWQHLAYVFEYETGDIFIYQNDNIIFESRGESVDIKNGGKIYIAKSAVTNSDFFNGSFHELRIWTKFLDIGEVYGNQYKAMTGNEVGLYGCWSVNEAFGNLAIDKAAFRHMQVLASWEVYPGGSAWNFSGNNYLNFYTGYFAIIPEMDYTIEFWFKDSNPTDTVCLFSNQKGDGKEGEGLMEKALSIFATPDGKIWVKSKGNLFEAASNDYFDNSWHHFALVVRRMGNAISYIDGQAQNETGNSVLGGISSGNMYLGVRKWDNTSTGEDWYYSGKLDEFRLWNLAKTKTQIKMDMNSKLHGDETGLMVYLPFEGYSDDGFGNQTLSQKLKNYVADVNAKDAISVREGFTHDAPNIKDARPVENVSFDYVAAEDQINILPKVFLMPQLEKNIIEITVEGVEDKFGNRMASPVTWTAYVHRNQVRWEDERRSFTKELYKQMEFVSSIKNTGGQQVGFSIANLPPWLTVNPSSGVINPESSIEITFTVNPALNIGDYNEDIILHTENGFDEKLPLTVRVFKTPPDWKVDPAKFEYSMNIVGRVKIEGVLSTDIFDKVAVFVNDSIRGVANVRYMKEFDSYLVFLTVYGNINKDQVVFRIWDASVGQILDEIIPDTIKFENEKILGSTREPVIFEAIGLYRQYISVAEGWNWLSFNKLARNQDNLNSFFSSLEPSQNDQIKTHGGGFNNFDLTHGWVIGSIDSIDNKRMYQMKISKNDTIVYSGMEIIPEDNPISLSVGWNHIGYLPDLAMDVNDALRLYPALEGEVIKSQFTFAMFDDRVGWLGNLDIMQPNLGYKFLVQNTGSFTYPNSTVFKGAKIPVYSSPPSGWGNNLYQYEGNMSVIARLDVSKNPEVTVNDQMVLGAFINDECHGFTSPINNSGIGYDPFFLNVSNSENGQWTKFRLFDGMTGNLYSIEETKPFGLNVVYGTIHNPLNLTLKSVKTSSGMFGSESFMRCYPNPFNDQINIEFSSSSGKVSIDVVNATGSLIRRIYDDYPTNGSNIIIWNGRNQTGDIVTSGMYYIRFVSGKTVETVKISKTR